MDIFAFDLPTIYSFLLTLMRASLVIFMFPIFNVSSLPAQWKGAFVVVFTFAIWPHVALSGLAMPEHPLGIFLFMFGELVLGIALGLSIRFFFAGIQSGGELISMQMGFSMITFADPMSGSQTGLVAHLLYMIATLVFFAFDGHLYLLKAFVETYKYIPAGGVMLGEHISTQIITLSATIFIFAVKIISPVLAALFLTEIGLALMSKAAPQMNILEFGFPLKILIGFFFIILTFNFIPMEVENYINGLDDLFLNLIRSMSADFHTQ